MKRVIALAAILLAGCGLPTSPGSSFVTARPSVAASASPTPSGVRQAVTLVVAEGNAPSQPIVLRFLTESGTETGHLGLAAGTVALVAGGRRIFVGFPSGGLKAIRKNGSGVALDSVLPQGLGPIIARDQAHWAWATSIQGNDGIMTVVKTAGEGSSPRQILSSTSGKGPLAPFAWTPAGIYMNPLPMDAVGYFPFQGPVVIGVMQLLNPSTGTTSPVQMGNDCTFGDVSDAGVIACYPVGPKPKLRLIYSPGNSLDLDLATPRFNYVGDAYFSRDSTMLTVAGATGVGMPAELSGGRAAQPEVYGVDLVTVRDGSIRRFGPAGTRVAMGEQSWLPDGKLVLWRPSEAAGGNAGLYVLDPSGSGQGTLIPTAGRPIGYLIGGP